MSILLRTREVAPIYYVIIVEVMLNICCIFSTESTVRLLLNGCCHFSTLLLLCAHDISTCS